MMMMSVGQFWIVNVDAALLTHGFDGIANYFRELE